MALAWNRPACRLPPRGRLDMSPAELNNLADRELLVLLHERVERLRETVEKLSTRVDKLSESEGIWSGAWSAVKTAVPWLTAAVAVWVAGRQAHLW
jgi:hypothetical protein